MPSEIWDNFRKNTTVAACGLINEKSKFQRFFWITCVLIGLSCVLYVTYEIKQNWDAEAVYITLDVSSLKITEVDFPGVAICDINKISRKRAINLANQLNSLTPNKNLNDTLELVALLGSLYDNNINGAANFPTLQNLLDSHDNGTSKSDMVVRLAALITPCSVLLADCSWDSVPADCMELFQTRLTDSGFCCIFNYIRRSSEADILKDANIEVPRESRQFSGIGVSGGLSVSININVSDYFYTSLSTIGCLLKIFLPGDFPDLISGSLRQIIVQENSEVFIKVEPNVLKSDVQIRDLKKKQRKCKFFDEEHTAFGMYTSSNCFVTCKLTSMHFLCNCIPVVLPIAEFKIQNEDVSFCNLVDVPCLNRYQGKWLRYYPQEATDFNELRLDKEDSLSCGDCYPNCDDVTYSIDTNYFEFFSNDPQYPNQSRIHVFSNKAYSNLYKKFVTVTWYEALSTFGGIVSILLGISIINFVEIAILLVKLLINR